MVVEVHPWPAAGAAIQVVHVSKNPGRLVRVADHPPVVQLQSTVPRFVSHPATRRDSTSAPPLTAFPVRKIRDISISNKRPDLFLNVAPPRPAGPTPRLMALL